MMPLTTAIRRALDNRGLTLLVCAVILGLGIRAWFVLPVDAYPDISAPEVLVITTYPGRAAEEIERQVTIPIELGMGSVPNVATIRSRTIFGLSVVSLVFEDGTEKYFARQRVTERLAALELPPGVTPELGPIASAYGEVFRYQLKSTGAHDVMTLRTLNDWVVIPRLQRCRGVTEVINFGGQLKQFTLKFDPRRLDRYGFTFKDVVTAIQENNANAGGSIFVRGDMSFVIRGRGLLLDESDIESTVVNTVGGTPVYVRDVAVVEVDSPFPVGRFGKDSDSDAVEGIVLMRRGENPSETLRHVRAEVLDLNTDALPNGVSIEPFYDRQSLVDSTLATVMHSVLSGIALVTLVLLAFLGSPSAALLVVLTIPFSLLFALMMMHWVDIPIGLLSVGAIDFGILVDGAVVMANQILRHVSQRKGPIPPEQLRQDVYQAAMEVKRPVFWSMLVIMCAYVPLLSLTRIEGLLFRPLALTVIFALMGAVLFSLLVLPGLATILLRRGYVDVENPVLGWFRVFYSGMLRMVLRDRWWVAAVTFVLVGLVGVGIVPRLGFDFLPYLDEGVIWVRANFPEGTALEQTARFGDVMRQIIREYPETSFAASQAGRNDSGTDPFVPSRLEVMIGLKPREEWAPGRTKADLLRDLGERLRSEFPTTRFNFTQPIIDSVTEDTNGTSANLAIEISGEDSAVLEELAIATREMLRTVRGAVDVNIEQEGPQPQLVIRVDRVRCAQAGVSVDRVNELINMALGGEPIGTLYDGGRRFDITARFDRNYMSSPATIGALPVFSSAGIPIPLAQVADFSLTDGPTIIAREGSRRRLTVRCDIVGRDQGGFVAEARQLFATTVQPQVPQGYRIRWIGMFENLERAIQHFAWVIPVTVGMIFAILFMTFGNSRDAALVLCSVPFAFIGGAVALYVRGMTLSVSSGVGFAALFGVSVMQGVLMVEWIGHLRSGGLGVDESILKAANARLRPILMTSIVAILGLVPASLADGLGSDVQRPLATVIVWGLFSSMLLNLFVLPALYRIVNGDLAWGRRPERHNADAGL
jgi:cobalt-zinc-cadmium resistance protein CzcA